MIADWDLPLDSDVSIVRPVSATMPPLPAIAGNNVLPGAAAMSCRASVASRLHGPEFVWRWQRVRGGLISTERGIE